MKRKARGTLNLLRPWLKRLVRLLSPWPLRRLIYRYLALRYVNSLREDCRRDRPTLLILNHFLDQDVRALRLANSEYNLVEVVTDRLFRGAKIFFDEEVRLLRAPYADADPVMVEKYRQECALIFDRLKAKFGLDMIITASDVYYWVREFILEGRRRGVKTVVLDKEGLRSPYGFAHESLRVMKLAPLISDHLLVWSERQRRFWNRSGIDDSRITVIGQPRSDLLFNERHNELDRLFSRRQKVVTLFSYMDDAYIPLDLAADGANWRGMKKETHDIVHEMARNYPDYNFVVKTHPQQPDLVSLQETYERDNLRVVGGSSLSNELLQRSELVIAFQTTVIIEAMFLGRRIIYTAWDELVPRILDSLLPYHEAKGLVICESADDFRRLCVRFLEGDVSEFEYSEQDRRDRDEFVGRFLYRPDGNVGARFFDRIGELLA